MPQYNRENLKGSNVEYNTVHSHLNFVISQPFTEIKQHEGAACACPDPYSRRSKITAAKYNVILTELAHF